MAVVNLVEDVGKVIGKKLYAKGITTSLKGAFRGATVLGGGQRKAGSIMARSGLAALKRPSLTGAATVGGAGLMAGLSLKGKKRKRVVGKAIVR